MGNFTFTKQQTIPKSCSIKFISINTPIWPRLAQTNQSLFYIEPEITIIIFINPKHNFNFEILYVEKLWGVHTMNLIILPRKTVVTVFNLDIIPENLINNILSVLPITVKSKMSQNITIVMENSFH